MRLKITYEQWSYIYKLLARQDDERARAIEKELFKQNDFVRHSLDNPCHACGHDKPAHYNDCAIFHVAHPGSSSERSTDNNDERLIGNRLINNLKW